MKSFRPKDGSGEPPAPARSAERDFHGEKRSNATHDSTADSDARLYRKGSGQPAKLAYLGHVLIENRHALVVDARLTLATGRRSARRRWRWLPPPRQSPDRAGGRQGLRRGRVCRRSAAAQCDPACCAEHHQSSLGDRCKDGPHPGYAVSGWVRQCIEEVFGGTKATAGFRKTRHRGLARVGWMFRPADQAGGSRGVVTAGLCPESGKRRQKPPKSPE